MNKVLKTCLFFSIRLAVIKTADGLEVNNNVLPLELMLNWKKRHKNSCMNYGIIPPPLNMQLFVDISIRFIKVTKYDNFIFLSVDMRGKTNKQDNKFKD